MQWDDNYIQARKGKITGSRIPAVLGHSPFQSKADLLREMVRELTGAPAESFSTPATDWGLKNERNGLDWYEFHHSMVDRVDFVVHPKYPFIGYSPDGHHDDVLIDIKCPFNQKIPDSAPLHYRDQLNLGLEVMGLTMARLVYWTPGGQRVFEWERDPQWFPSVLTELEEFHRLVHSELKNPEHQAGKFVEREDFAWISRAEELLSLKGKAKELEEEIARVTAEIKSMAGGAPSKGGGITLYKTVRSGGYDYQRLIKELGLSSDQLDPYKKPDIEIITIR